MWDCLLWELILSFNENCFQNYEVYVAESNGETVGYYSIVENEGECWLDHFFTKPKYEGDQVDKLLIDHAKNQCQTKTVTISG